MNVVVNLVKFCDIVKTYSVHIIIIYFLKINVKSEILETGLFSILGNALKSEKWRCQLCTAC